MLKRNSHWSEYNCRRKCVVMETHLWQQIVLWRAKIFRINIFFPHHTVERIALIDGFHGFTSGGFCVCAAVCKIQASKCYIESLPPVLTDERSCFSEGETSTVQLPFDHTFAFQKYVGCLVDIRKPSISTCLLLSAGLHACGHHI